MTVDQQPQSTRERSSDASLQRLMAPTSVAIVGASPSGRHGRPMVENLTSLGFAGTVYAVNPKYEEVLGARCYPTLHDLPEVPDAVMIGVSRGRARDVLHDAADLGVGGVVLTAIGYGESGTAVGRRAQQEIADLAQNAGMALIGPNCMGLINFTAASALYLDPVRPYTAGHVSLLSHSGSIAIALTNNRRGVRWSHVVSTGNEAVTGAADLLSYAVDDPATTVITAFLETIRYPDAFFAQCDRAHAAGKPVVVLKSGRGERSQAAAQAHSGALALPDRLIDELLRRHHVIRVWSMEDLLSTVNLLSAGRTPHGHGLAVVSESGGEVGLIHDEADRLGVSLPAIGGATRERMAEYLPAAEMVTNPLDLWALPEPEVNYPRVLRDLAEDPGVSTMLVVGQTDFGPTVPGDASGANLRAVKDLASVTTKPIALVAPITTSLNTEMVQDMQEAGVAVLTGFGDALRAVAHVATHAASAAAVSSESAPANAALERCFAILDGKASSGAAALDLLAAAGIPTVPSALVDNADDAVIAAERLGYPVVVKTGDPAILHKTEANAVFLNVAEPSAVRDAFEHLRMATMRPASVLVQAQITAGAELILGAQYEPSLGSFILVGSGGIWAEQLRDVSIRPVRLRADDAPQMLGALRIRELFGGLRGRPALDEQAVMDAIARMDALAQLLGPRIISIDVNPLAVLPTGVVALDALVVPSDSDARDRG